MQVLTVKDPDISVDVTLPGKKKKKKRSESLSPWSLGTVASAQAHPSPAGLSWGCSHRGSSVDFAKAEVHLPGQKRVVRICSAELFACNESTNLLRWDSSCCGGRRALGWSFGEEDARHRVCRRLSKTSMSSWGVYREKRQVHCDIKKIRPKREASSGDYVQHLTHFFWLCMDKVTFVLSNSMLTLWGTNWWNLSTASVWMNSVASHPESKQCRYEVRDILSAITWRTM